LRLFGFLLLLAGWGIVLSALALFATETSRVAFVLAGVGVEIVGLVLVIRAHPIRRSAHE
jgi:CHASE1-domain containing sensor protein